MTSSVSASEHIPLPVDSLPYWQGISDKASPSVRLPFRLGVGVHGFLCQDTDDDIRDRIVKHYATGEYRFITAPPGTSDWGNQLSKAMIESVQPLISRLKPSCIVEIGAGTTYIANRLLQADKHKTNDTSEIEKYVIFDPAVIEIGENHPKISIVPRYFRETRPSFPLI